MDSSRMRTVRNSSRLLGGSLHPPSGPGRPLGTRDTPLDQGDSPRPGRAPWADPPQLPPWLWAWTGSPSTSPLAVGLDLIPLNFPLGCGPGDPPPRQIPLNFPLGCGPGNLQGMLAYPTPPPPRPAARHAGIPPAIHAGIAPPPPPR